MTATIGFIKQTTKDYDMSEYLVQNIANKSTDANDFYQRLEDYISERSLK